MRYCPWFYGFPVKEDVLTNSRRGALALLLLAVLCAAVAPGAAQSNSAATAGAAEMTLFPGDLVRVDVWRMKDLSGEFLVDPRGKVTLPLLGERTVAGIPLTQLRDTLLAEYRVQLRNPSITIVPLRRVNVLGEVNAPGQYALEPSMTLVSAIAMARGANSIGNLKRVHIIRDGETIHKSIGAGETLQSAEIRSGDQIYVGRTSWLERNTGLVVGTLLAIPSVVLTILDRT